MTSKEKAFYTTYLPVYKYYWNMLFLGLILPFTIAADNNYNKVVSVFKFGGNLLFLENVSKIQL